MSRVRLPFALVVAALLGFSQVWADPLTPVIVCTTLHSFSPFPEGAAPDAPLLQGRDGNLYGTTARGGIHNGGVFFKLTPAGAFSSLYAFGSHYPGGPAPNGWNPAGLLQGGDGSFYGTTRFGGRWGGGTLFRIAPNGMLATVVSFPAGDGGRPVGGLVAGTNACFYGTTAGGSNWFGTVFELRADGTLATLYRFVGGDFGANPNGGLTRGADGNLYGTTATGGHGGGGLVFELTPGGAFIPLYSFTGGSDGGAPNGGLVQGRDGFFYGSTTSGGTGGFGTVFKVAGDGTFRTLYAFTGGIDGAAPNGSLALDVGGNCYGTTSAGGKRQAGTVFSVSTYGNFAVLHSFGTLTNRLGQWLDGASPETGLSWGSDGKLYGAAAGGGVGGLGTFFKISPAGAFTALRSIAGANDAGYPTAGLLRSNLDLYGTSSVGGTNGAGTVFKITTGGTLSLLHGFGTNRTEGTDLQTGLAQGADGNFYGTAFLGGQNHAGTLFRITPAGDFTPVYSFGNTTNDAGLTLDGAAPQARLVQGLDGRFYGTASHGGGDGFGTVFALSPGGPLTTLHTFGGGADDGAGPCAGLTPDKNGNFYGATAFGGATDCGMIFALTASGSFTNLYRFGQVTNSAGVALDGARPLSTVIRGANGDFYGTTARGGSNDLGTVFEIGPAGNLTVLHSFGALTNVAGVPLDGAGPVAGLLQGLDGNFYGTTASGGSNNVGTVFQLTPAGELTTLYSFGAITNAAGICLDGAVPQAELVQGADGFFYGTTCAGGAWDGGTVFSLGRVLPSVGSLQVKLMPPAAAGAGAQWEVDGSGTVEASGATVTNLVVGGHTVRFTAPAGWESPPNQIVGVTANHTSVVTGTYLPQTGSLQVMLTPSAAVNAGARWRVDDGPFYRSGTILSNLVVITNHVVSFQAARGFAPPPPQIVSITNHLTTMLVAACLDTNPPTLTILSPRAGRNVRDASFAAAGTATDNVAVSNVVCLLNGRPADSVTTTNHWSTWAAKVSLAPGTNTLLAYAIDTSGNESNIRHLTLVYNRFLEAAGTYSGLFAVPGAPRQQTNSGAFTFHLTSRGSFSGNLRAGSASPALAGTFNLDGLGQAASQLPGGRSLVTTFQMDFTHQTVTGTVRDGEFVAQVAGFRNVFTPANPASAYAGEYTLVVLGTSDPTLGPQGVSYGTVTISPSGVVTFRGALADGTTAVSQSGAISQDGYWPLYVPLPGGTGSLWAWNSLSNRTLMGSASWIKPASTSRSALYPGGFTNQDARILGSWYASTNQPLFGFGQGRVLLAEAGASPFTVTNYVAISRAGAITVTNPVGNPNGLSLAINHRSGVITGRFFNPLNPRQTVRFNGVLLQAQSFSAGYFPGTNLSGMFLLTP